MPRLSLLVLSIVLLTAKGFAQSPAHEALKNLQKQVEQVSKEKSQRIQVYLGKARAAQRDGLLLVDVTPNGWPIYIGTFNAGAAATTGASRLQNQLIGLNLVGENMVVGVWDEGIVKNHIEFDTRILTKEGVQESLHSTHVTGTILATGINASAKGMAPKAKATTWDYDNDIAEMLSLVTPDQSSLLFSNHSYGTITGWYKQDGVWTWSDESKTSNDEDYRFGFYDNVANILDQIAFLSPYYTIMRAAGNDRAEVGDGTHPADGNGGTGYDCIIPEANAKNVITIGAVNKVSSYTGPASVVLSNFSSTGPSDDGRIKPDMVAAGVSLFSTSNTTTSSYATLSGTSMATPNATGSLVLVQELYKKLHGGNFMRAATLKGLAIHTTKEAGSFPGPDYQYGWGLLDVEAAAKVLLQEDNENNFIQEHTLNNGGTFTIPINSKANQKITVTICWTDLAGTPVKASLDPTDLMLVNDLDVRVTDSASTTIFPWILNPFVPSNKATTGDNFRDNVEKIEFDSPEAKKYYVNVRHKGILKNGKQDFSIIVTCKSSLSTATTYYWVGSNGNWNDGTHWSLSSGGAAANTPPGSGDYAMFDENSFDNVAGRTVTLTADAAVKKLTWITDKSAGVSLSGHTLKLSGDVSIAGKNFQITTTGTLQFESAAGRSFTLHSGDISNASLLFNGGTWNVEGDFIAKDLTVANDEVMWTDLSSTLSSLTVANTASIDISGSNITGLTQSSCDVTGSVKSNSTTSLIINNDATFNWSGVNYAGDIKVASGKSLAINGSNTINELIAASGVTINLSGTTTQEISTLSLSSNAANHVKIQSSGNATINMPVHQKLCFDFIDVSNVDLTGNTIVSAGLNSSIINADNWQKNSCTDAVFADFDATFMCVNSLATFTDKSTGNLVSWSWNFGDVDSGSNTANTQNAFHIFETAGKYTVTLTVSDGVSIDIFTKEINIGTNNLSANSIILNSGTLKSVHQASSYQWFKDGNAIQGAISRSFNYDGNAGTYSVVINSGGTCNAVSSFVIAGVEEAASGIKVFPIPASDVINLHKPDAKRANVRLYNALGQSVIQAEFDKTDMVLDVKHIPEGFYHIEIRSASYIHQQKIVIDRN
jgi:PKD repeat protein